MATTADMSSILTAIAADTALTSWNPAVCTLPEYELKETKTAKCCIVPAGIRYRNQTRDSVKRIFVVELGFLKRGKVLDVKALVGEIETIAIHIMKQTYSGARVVAVENEPLYDDEQLRTKSLFQSVLSVQLQEL